VLGVRKEVESPSKPGVIRFGIYEFKSDTKELRKGGMRVRLEGQPITILKMLLDRPGELVAREDIQKELWPGDTFVDFDHSLNAAIKRLRAALNDSADHPHYIETLARRGYRFIAPVNGEEAEGEVQAVAAIPSSGQPRQRWWVFSVTALLALVVVGLIWQQSRPRQVIGLLPTIRSLAVLPLQSLSGDPSQQYFADGMTEALIGSLSRIHDLRVISRTSVMRFKETRQTIPEIARALHVDAVLEGAVIREGDQIRIHAQLIRGATDEHIWAGEYQREYRGILVLQDEVAKTIAQRIQINLTPQDQVSLARSRAVDPEAYEDYLKGRYYFNQRTTDTLNKSIGYFRQAIAKDSSYALPYCGLADAYALLGFRGGVPSKEALSQAKTAALKAIALDDTQAEPHVSLAFIAETHEWDWATAEREYKRALQLNPGDAGAHHWYAGYLMYVGRFNEGILEERRARELDPLSLPINNALAGRLLVTGQYDQALTQVRETLEMDSHFAPAHQTLGWAYLNIGRPREAIQEFQEALQLSGKDDKDFLVDLGFAYAATGNRVEAQNILVQLTKLNQKGLVPPGSIAILYGSLGELDKAFAWMDKAYKERDPELTYIKVPGRRFEPLRRDPRFQDLVRRMGLPA
jgi:TolB-like protein/DNA-binding winged helix-turn-helix (wHTH) protein/Flp pilus assembly protein TadD